MKVFLPLLVAIANGIALAQGPIAPGLAPLKYKLLFENDKVRVIEEHLKPREKEPMHSHPYGVFACFLTDAHIRTTFPDGSTSEDSKKAGDTIWRDLVTHAGENIGNAEIHEIMIEPRSASQGSGSMVVSSPSPSAPISPGQPMPASQEPHHHVRYESQYVRILEVLLEPGENSFFHTHSNDILYVTLADAVARTQEQDENWGPETAFSAGAVSFEEASKTPHTHRLKNVGKTQFHASASNFCGNALNPRSWCGVPTIVGHYLVQSVPATRGLIVLDITNGSKPEEVSRLKISEAFKPRWTGWDAKTQRLVVTGREPRLFLVKLDHATGALAMDDTFHDVDGKPGFNFAYHEWPHGWKGSGLPHGVVFSR